MPGASRTSYAPSKPSGRSSWHDDEADERVWFEFTSEREARHELGAGGEDDSRILSSRPGLVGTPKLFDLTGIDTDPVLAKDALVIAHARLCIGPRTAANPKGLDGVWWNDDLDPWKYSAPRGLIFDESLPLWEREIVARPRLRRATLGHK